MKVSVFGDSIAKGIIYDNEKRRYTYLKESFINMIQQNSTIEIDNFSCFGGTVTKGDIMLHKVEDQLAEYEYTFLEYGGNDCDYNWAKVAENPDLDHECNTPINLFKDKYRTLIDRIKATGSKPILVTLPPIDSIRFFNWVSKGLNKKNILKFLGDVEHIARWQAMFNDAVKHLSDIYKLPLLDIRTTFFKQKRITDFLCEDGIHPNKDGHKLIYNVIATKANLAPIIA